MIIRFLDVQHVESNKLEHVEPLLYPGQIVFKVISSLAAIVHCALLVSLVIDDQRELVKETKNLIMLSSGSRFIRLE